MKLYTVVMADFRVVRATDDSDAEVIARSMATATSEVLRVKPMGTEFPPGWSRGCYPWGRGDPPDGLTGALGDYMDAGENE